MLKQCSWAMKTKGEHAEKCNERKQTEGKEKDDEEGSWHQQVCYRTKHQQSLVLGGQRVEKQQKK